MGKSDTYNLLEASIDEDRPLRIVAIGAGFSGILAGIRIPQRMKNVELVIYEKNSGVGGTWFSNRYPGVACDFPSHCYQLTFETKADWSTFYSFGPEIRVEVERLIEKYKLMPYIKLRHELTRAQYNEDTGKWHLKIRRPALNSTPENEQFEEFEDISDFVLSGAGILSRWDWPKIEGLWDFKGKLIHSAAWETDESGWWQSSISNWGDKMVGIIGGGSSTTQIVPEIQPRVKHLYTYVRGKTWLAPPFVSDVMSNILDIDSTKGNYRFTDEDKRRLSDPEFYKKFRHEVQQGMESLHLWTIKGTPMQIQAQKDFQKHMKDKLVKKPWIIDHLMPDFSVTCRRLTPGPGYLEALDSDNVDFVPTTIKRITETGIELVDGTKHNLDILILATGYDTSFLFPFDVIGRGGKSLRERYQPYPETYLSMCTDGFPNWFMTNGPNSCIGVGNLLLIMERQVDYIVEVAKKLQRERLKSIDPKIEAVKDFDEYLEAYFKTSVFSEGCSSWYKLGKNEGRIVGLWPGSSSHEVKALAYPRWEDYNYEPLDSGVTNRFFWLGDGSTYNEKHMTGDRAWYLNPDEIDYPPVPEA